ncbi:hypothetical protein C8T65DRAFT_650332 [Cerioporus squamosus]|nr:hypothetical protein C8T65DRAFT_650332 [Cerioporus squamosus]
MVHASAVHIQNSPRKMSDRLAGLAYHWHPTALVGLAAAERLTSLPSTRSLYISQPSRVHYADINAGLTESRRDMSPAGLREDMQGVSL